MTLSKERYSTDGWMKSLLNSEISQVHSLFFQDAATKFMYSGKEGERLCLFNKYVPQEKKA